jgi:hypothetical protein
VLAPLTPGQAESTGANCTLQPFLDGFSPNVICTYPSNSTEHVILSAHYDSRGSFGETRAPGGDDDGSGSGHLLAVARAIGASGISFNKSVTLAWFAGEEQGLLGSHAYAGAWRIRDLADSQKSSPSRTQRSFSKSKPTCWATTSCVLSSFLTPSLL